MDLGITLIGVIIILLFILPIIIVTRNSKSGDKKSLKRINDLATISNSSISQFEILNNKIIGIDNDNLKLFFSRKTTEGFQENVINLAEIKKCQILSFNKKINNIEGSYKVTEKIELSFTYFDINKQKQILDCYNIEYDNFMINEEFKFAEKWEKIINNILYENTHKIKNAKAS